MTRAMWLDVQADEARRELNEWPIWLKQSITPAFRGDGTKPRWIVSEVQAVTADRKGAWHPRVDAPPSEEEFER